MIKVDRNKIYESHGYRFKNFVALSDEEKKMILDWRNYGKVRDMMVTKKQISLKDHYAFIESLNHREDCFYWLVIDPKGTYLGVVDVIHIDMSADLGEIGYYINPAEVGDGFTFMIECLYFVFKNLQLKYNQTTVNVKNREILLFNKYLGAKFEGKEKIGNETFYFNRRSTGQAIIDNYETYNLLDYARFVRKYRGQDLVF